MVVQDAVGCSLPLTARAAGHDGDLHVLFGVHFPKHRSQFSIGLDPREPVATHERGHQLLAPVLKLRLLEHRNTLSRRPARID